MSAATLLTHSGLRPYLDDVRLWHGYVRFLGLPTLQDNPDTPLSELFVLPALAEQRVAPEASTEAWPPGRNLFDLLVERRRLVVLGDPGSGKSTIVNWLAWLLAGGLDTEFPEPLEGVLPLPMIARELQLDRIQEGFEALLDAFLARPVAERLQGEREEVLARLAEGRAIVLLDGLDEVPLEQRRALRDALRECRERFPQALQLVTSRIVGYEDCPVEPPMEPLDPSLKLPEDVEARLSIASKSPAVYVMPFDDERIGAFAQQWYRLRTVRQLADQDAGAFLRAVHANPAVEALARLPQLLTLMALVYRVRTQLPDGRAMLYDLITEAYLESIDKARQLERSDDESRWQEKRRWLARVGFEMQLRRKAAKTDKADAADARELLVSRSQVLRWIRQAMKDSGYPSSEAFARDYLDWVARRSGLLLPRGEDRYAFVHLSFQEYFAALYLVEHVSDADWVIAQRDGSEYQNGDARVTAKAIGQWARHALWQEVFVFCYECFANEPRRARRLTGWVFGDELGAFRDSLAQPDMAEPALGQTIRPDSPLGELLARLIGNPHSGWTPAEREQGFGVLFEYLQRIERVFDPEAAVPVFGIEQPAFARVLANRWLRERFWRSAAVKKPRRLLLLGGNVRLEAAPVMPTIQSIAFGACDESDLGEVARRFPQLQSLTLHSAPLLTSLAGLERLELRHLSVARAPIETPGTLPVKLASLVLSGCPITAIDEAAVLPDLAFLSVVNTRIRDLTPLRRCRKLESLFVVGTPVQSLDPLVDLPALKHLMIGDGVAVPPQLLEREASGALTIFRS